MAYDTPKITSSGQGMWGNNNPSTEPKASMSQNALSEVGKNSAPPKVFTGNPTSPGVGPNGSSPDMNLLSTGSDGNGTPFAGPNGPSPDQNLLSTAGKSGSPPARPSFFGGVEKGVQIQ